MKIDGLAAVVTGGASGLGAATARTLAEAGAKVAIFDVQEEKGQEMAAEISATFCHCDVTSGESAEAAFAAAKEANGPVRIMVNCAGTGIAAKTTSGGAPHPLESFSKIIQINL